MREVERLEIWRADLEWSDTEKVVKASDYDDLVSENHRLRKMLAEHQIDFAGDKKAKPCLILAGTKFPLSQRDKTK